MYKNITVNECLYLSFLLVLRLQKTVKSAIKNSTQVYYKCTKRKFIQLSLNKNTKQKQQRPIIRIMFIVF